ncbi:MAG: hypothetical protein ABIR29_04415 [Chthoniobacterales bacterium]
MNTKRTMLVAAALWLTAAAVSFAASAHIGTWKLNEAKSKFADGATKNHTVTYSEAKGGMIKLTVEGTDKDGKAVKWTWQGKFDGQPHKTNGSPMADQIAYKSTNDHSNEMTVMKDGKVVMTGTITVSKDGKSRVVKTTMTGADGKKHTDKAVYDRQ